MGRAALSRKKAVDVIGQARVAKLEEAGLMVLDADEYARLKAKIGELERDKRLLQEAVRGSGAASDVAAQILASAMRS